MENSEELNIEKVLEILRPNMDIIEANYFLEKEKFDKLFQTNHESLGRVLKCHLIIESYIDRYLTDHYRLENIEKVRLSFFQKAMLLPEVASVAAFAKPGILQLNTIRNKFAHRLEHILTTEDLGPIGKILTMARHNVDAISPIDAIEIFTPLACTFLLKTPEHIGEMFARAVTEAKRV